MELIKEKKRLKGKIETLEISNNNLIVLTGTLEEENKRQSSEVIKLQQKLDGVYKELEEKIHELAIEKAKKYELETSLKESQHAVSVLTLGAEKVTKMINFGKINNDKKGLGYEEGKVYSNFSTTFVKSISPPLNSKIDSQDKILHKESNNSPKIVPRSNMSKTLNLGNNVSNNLPFKTRTQTKYIYQPKYLPKLNFQQPKQNFQQSKHPCQNHKYRQEIKFKVTHLNKLFILGTTISKLDPYIKHIGF